MLMHTNGKAQPNSRQERVEKSGNNTVKYVNFKMYQLRQCLVGVANAHNVQQKLKEGFPVHPDGQVCCGKRGFARPAASTPHASRTLHCCPFVFFLTP